MTAVSIFSGQKCSVNQVNRNSILFAVIEDLKILHFIQFVLVNARYINSADIMATSSWLEKVKSAKTTLLVQDGTKPQTHRYLLRGFIFSRCVPATHRLFCCYASFLYCAIYCVFE